MIKKILTALFALCLISPVSSFGVELRITDMEALQKVLEMHLPNDKDKQAAVLNSLVSAGGKILTNVNDFRSIELCKAAGFVDMQPSMYESSFVWYQEDIKDNMIATPNDKCKRFIEDIAWIATGLFYNVCDGWNGPKSATARCSRSFYAFQGQQLNGVGLAKEWALLPNHNDSRYAPDDIVCEKTFTTKGNDDYLRCKSTKTRRYYEFQFDDLIESFDDTIRESLGEHIYWLHGASLTSTKEVCDKVNETAKKFNMKAVYRSSPLFGGRAICMLSFNDKTSISQLRTACDIDPFAFLIGDDIQINTTSGVEIQLRNYVASKCGIDADAVSCAYAAVNYSGYGGEDEDNDILTCHFYENSEGVPVVYGKDGEPLGFMNRNAERYNKALEQSGGKIRRDIDFVFDDLSEYNRKTVNAGNQAMGCIVMGGTYNGKDCMHLTKETCDKINENMALGCSNCSRAYWDSKEGICRLPDATSESEKEEMLNAALLVVGTGVAIAITLATGGTGAAVWALVAIETTGAVIEGVATHDINQALDDFFAKSNKCKIGDCVPALIKEGMERIVHFANDMTDGQVNGFDAEMARLFGLLDPESDIVQEILDKYDGDLSVASNKGDLFDADSWEPEQVWRAVGVVMQFASVFASIGKWLFKGGKAAQTVLTKTDDAMRLTLTRAQAKKLDDLADLATDLTKRRQAAGLAKSQADDLWRQLKNVNQQRQTLVKSLGLADQSDDVIKLLQREAYLADDLAKASDDLAKATERADKLYMVNKNGQKVLAQGVTKYDVKDVQRAIDVAQSGIDKITTELAGVTKQLDDIYGVGKTTTKVVTTGGDDAARLIDGDIAKGAVAKVAILEGRNQLLKPEDLNAKPVVPNTPGVLEPGQRVMDPLPAMNGITGSAVMMATGAGLAGVPDVVWDYDVEIDDEDIEVEDVVIDTSDYDDIKVNKIATSKSSSSKSYSPSSAKSSKSNTDDNGLKSKEVKDPRKTGLIATAAVLGAVGTGLLVGGLVSRDKDDNAKASSKAGGNTKLEKDLETILNNSDKSLGFVNGSMIKLVPMNTVNGTNAKIVNINGNAVAVVDYRGHRLPYYVNGQTGSWVPLLGIGKTGGWFNTYLSNTPPAIITQISNVLNQQLKPEIAAQFVGANALGVQFPMPMQTAYDVINAEFPGGVVETFNGVFSPSDQQLYNSNYQRIKKIA